jgi:hypothetical protein
MEDRLTAEYGHAFESWRFLVGLRFTVIGFFLTLNSALLFVVLTLPVFKVRAYQYLCSTVGLLFSVVGQFHFSAPLWHVRESGHGHENQDKP